MRVRTVVAVIARVVATLGLAVVNTAAGAQEPRCMVCTACIVGERPAMFGATCCVTSGSAGFRECIVGMDGCMTAQTCSER